jgi:hypothetical protein
MQYLLDLMRYFAWCVVEGDELNDWLTHLPHASQPAILEMGKALVNIFGG